MRLRQRLVWGAGIALTAYAYALFLLPVISGILLVRANNPQGIWTDAHELPETHFAMFWYAGRMLIMQFVDAHGGHMVPSAWMLRTFQVPLIAHAKPLVFTWLYPPTMGLLSILYADCP